MKRSDLLGQTAMLPAALAKARSLGGLGVLPPARLQLGEPAAPRRGLRRYAVGGPAAAEVVHHRPITAKARRRYVEYLERYGRELREKLAASGIEPARVEAEVAAALAAPPVRLEREETHRTAARPTALLDLGAGR